MLFIENKDYNIIIEPRPEITNWKIRLSKRIENEYEPYVYIVQEVSSGRYYIGSRTKIKCKDSDLGQSYFTSSKNITEIWKADSTKFDIIFKFRCESNRAALWYESFLIKEFDSVKRDLFINKSNGGHTFCMSGTEVSKETRAKLSRANKGKRTISEEHRKILSEANKGKTKTDSHKKKLSEANKGKLRSKESKEKQSKTITSENNHFYGKAHSEESRKKMAENKKDKPLSETHKDHMRESKLGDRNYMFGKTHSDESRQKQKDAWAKLPTLICPHCGMKSISVGNMNRYHFDKCKLNPNLPD